MKAARAACQRVTRLAIRAASQVGHRSDAGRPLSMRRGPLQRPHGNAGDTLPQTRAFFDLEEIWEEESVRPI